MDFSACLAGVHLARRLAQKRLREWGFPSGTPTHDATALIVGEFAANAVQHGTAPGERFRLCLTVTATDVRVTVTDTCGEMPARRTPSEGTDEGGRGLLLVSALADRWDVIQSPESRGGKTIWAEVSSQPQHGGRATSADPPR